MTINIVTDSSCDLYRLPETGGAVRYTSIPFVFTIGIGTDQGEIEIKGKVRGKLRAMEEILKDMRAWGKPVSRVVITQCQNLEMAQTLKTRILSHWPGAAIDIQPTRGLCSYYAERHGLIVSYA